MSNMRQRLEELLQHNTNSAALRFELEALARTDTHEFANLAEVWAPAIYQRDPRYFASFLTDHLIDTETEIRHKDLIESLLPQIADQGPVSLFQTLYSRVVTNERWNRELLALAQSDLSGEEVKKAVVWRSWSHYNRKRDFYLLPETALSLYRRSPKDFCEFISQNLSSSENMYRPLLDEARKRGDGVFYWTVFQHTADQAAWRKAILDLIGTPIPADQIQIELNKRHVRREMELETEIWQAVLDKYGETVKPYVLRNSRALFRWEVQMLMASDLDNEQLLDQLSTLRNFNWVYFGDLVALWAIPLYERDAAFFESFLLNALPSTHSMIYLPSGQPVYRGADKPAEESPAVPIMRDLMARGEADGRDLMFRLLYQRVTNLMAWNADLLALAQSADPDDVIFKKIDQRNGSTTRQYPLFLKTAMALYRRNPDLFGEFVRTRVKRGPQDTDQLRQEAFQSGDEPIYWLLFREWADDASWQVEMESLLAQDIPAEQIVAELEKRHPNHQEHVQPAILNRFYQKYGEAVLPYLEKHLSMVSRKRLESLLALKLDRTTLLRELERLARSQPIDFRGLAEVWAPALYDRDPVFFEPFLIRNLDTAHANVIYGLLPRIESAGQNSLFKALYRKIVREDVWNYELRELAASDLNDEAVLEAIERRDAGRWVSIADDIALNLYRRNPDLFRAFIKDHVRPHRVDSERIRALREAARQQGDEDLYWHLFRLGASKEDWEAEMRALLARVVPSEQIGAEILKRQRTNMWDVDSAIMFEFLKKYGMVVWDQVAPHIRPNGRQRKPDAMLAVVQNLGDDALYWKVFFQIADDRAWNHALHELLKRKLSDQELWDALRLRLPPQNEISRWRRWNLQGTAALALYRRLGDSARPILTRYATADVALFREAMAQGDDELLDFFTFQMMRTISGLIHNAYPEVQRWGHRKADQEARQKIEELGKVATERLDRLFEESPDLYVRHAGNILAHFHAFEVWSLEHDMAHNPIFAHLFKAHPAAWLESPVGIRELIESPNIYIQILALAILGEGGLRAAERTVENLMMLRALLLSPARRNTKKKVLRCLERAMEQGPDFATQIVPVLEDTMDFRGERTISDRLVVSFVRARRALAQAAIPEGVI